MIAGLIAQRFGPVIGGFFLAFPAIFPASASLVEAHEEEHKARAGFNGTKRGRVVAAIDALGTAMGCIGLAGFALVFWMWLPRAGVAQTFVLATLVWLTSPSESGCCARNVCCTVRPCVPMHLRQKRRSIANRPAISLSGPAARCRTLNLYEPSHPAYSPLPSNRDTHQRVPQAADQKKSGKNHSHP